MTRWIDYFSQWQGSFMNFMEVRVCVNTKNGKNVYCKLHQIIKPKEFRRFVDDTPLLKKKKNFVCLQKTPTVKGVKRSVAARNSNKSRERRQVLTTHPGFTRLWGTILKFFDLFSWFTTLFPSDCRDHLKLLVRRNNKAEEGNQSNTHAHPHTESWNEIDCVAFGSFGSYRWCSLHIVSILPNNNNS